MLDGNANHTSGQITVKGNDANWISLEIHVSSLFHYRTRNTHLFITPSKEQGLYRRKRHTDTEINTKY